MSQDVPSKIFSEVAVGHQAVRDGDRANRVVGERTTATEERKLLRLDVPVLVYRTADVTGYGTEHQPPLSERWPEQPVLANRRHCEHLLIPRSLRLRSPRAVLLPLDNCFHDKR